MIAEESNKSEEEVKQEPSADTAETSNNPPVGDVDLHPADEGADEQPKKPEQPAEEKPKKPEPEPEIDEVTTLHERIIAALSYIGFLAVVPFYLKKDSKFCRHHGKQGILIAIMFFFAKLLLVVDLLMDAALVLEFVIFLYMGLATLSGRWKRMPLIYKWSCDMEDTLSLKTKDELANEEAFKPGQTKSAADAVPETKVAKAKHAKE